MNTSSKESSVRHVASTRKRAFVAGVTGLSIAAAAGGVLILANPASAVPVANSICHSTGNGAFVLIEPNDEGVVHGHSSHSNDIIPNSRNWTAPNIAIWNNNCVAPIPSPTATPTITPTVTPSPSVTPTVTPTPTPTEGGSALVPICLPLEDGKFKMDDVMISALLQKPGYTVKSTYVDAVFAQLTPASYSWLGETTVPSQGNQVLLGNNCLMPTPAVTVTTPGTNTTTTNTVTVPGPTVTVTATPTPTASAVPPVAVAPVVTPSTVPPVAVAPVAAAPVAAAVPTAVNAGDGSSQNRPMSPVGIVLLALAGVGVLYAALKLSTRRRSSSSQ